MNKPEWLNTVAARTVGNPEWGKGIVFRFGTANNHVGLSLRDLMTIVIPPPPGPDTVTPVAAATVTDAPKEPPID